MTSNSQNTTPHTYTHAQINKPRNPSTIKRVYTYILETPNPLTSTPHTYTHVQMNKPINPSTIKRVYIYIHFIFLEIIYNKTNFKSSEETPNK
jgi:hypothetical protein